MFKSNQSAGWGQRGGRKRRRGGRAVSQRALPWRRATGRACRVVGSACAPCSAATGVRPARVAAEQVTCQNGRWTPRGPVRHEESGAAAARGGGERAARNAAAQALCRGPGRRGETACLTKRNTSCLTRRNLIIGAGRFVFNLSNIWNLRADVKHKSHHNSPPSASPRVRI